MPEPSSSNYPTSLDDATTLGGDAVNLTSFILNGAITSIATTITMTVTLTGLVNVPCYLLVNNELIYATGISGPSFTGCVRGAGGTTNVAHSDGSAVMVVYAANLFNQLKRGIIAIETELGVNPSGSEATVVARLNNPGIDIHAATSKATPVDADEIGLWDSVAPTVFKKLTWANVKATLNAVYDWATVTHAATGKTTPVDADELSIVDSAASNVIKKLTWANVKATSKTYFDTLYQADAKVPDAFRTKYIITPSISSNNLTLAIKYVDGNDCTATNKIIFRVGDTEYTLSAAVSFTKNAGTNWFNSGGAELAAQNIDYFVYAIGETGASAGLKFGFSRIPYAKTMGDFINTTTNQMYIAGNYSTFTSSDNVVNIGRFRAQLSATASFNWSIPSSSVINYPIYETSSLQWTPTLTGFAATPTVALAIYVVHGRTVEMTYRFSGTSNATGMTFTTPFAPSSAFINNNIFAIQRVTDSGVASFGMIQWTSGSIVTCYKDAAGNLFTATGAKGVDGSVSIAWLA